MHAASPQKGKFVQIHRVFPASHSLSAGEHGEAKAAVFVRQEKSGDFFVGRTVSVRPGHNRVSGNQLPQRKATCRGPLF
jgi:hypothetical protein